MKSIPYIPSVVDFAREIILLDRENHQLKEELELCREYEKKYTDLLNSSIKHSQNMMGNLLRAVIDPKSIISLGINAKIKEDKV